ncbi:MAG: hypothetical protein ACLP7J_26875 [Streptosporangiaceae bacterium]
MVPLVTAGLFAVVALGRMLGLPWWAVPSLVLAVAFAGSLAVLSVAGTGVSAGFAAVASGVALGWVAYAAVATPWSEPAVLGLLIPAVFLGLLYPVVRGHHQHAVEEARRQEERARALAEARRWPDLFARVGAKGVTVLDSAETRAGHTLRIGLPASGKVTFSKLEKLAEPLEVASRLRDGAIRFERGDHAGEALMHVSEKDILAQVIPYPDDLSDLTITRPFGIGLYEDGTVCEVTYREVCALIVGFRGSGKSNLMNVKIAQLGRCVDSLIFMIDLKGGRTALPWIQPWLDGKTPRPVIDWVATNREEAERILDAIRRAVDKRAHAGTGGEKITPSPEQPAVILIVDELASIAGMHGSPAFGEGTSNTKLAGKVFEVAQLGRSEAIDAILATQRGTVTMTGGGDLKSQCQLRIGLGVASEADARLIIPDDASVARILPKLKHKGSGVVSDNDGRLSPLKFWRIDTEHSNDAIYRIATELGDRRPEPERLLAEALGDDYAQRWSMERAGHIPAFARAARRLAVAQGTTGEDVRRRFEEITSDLEFGGDEEPAGDAVSPARQKMLDMLRAAGVMGMTPELIRRRLEEQGLGVARQTIQRWLTEEAKAGRVENASFGRWKFTR